MTTDSENAAVVDVSEDRSAIGPPPFATTTVLLIAGVTGVLLLIASRNYGYFFDEAYFVVAGHDYPAWGYFDQPPLVPMLAGLAQQVAPGSLLVVRLPATIAAVGGVVVTAMIARELGGRRAAQAIAAAAYAMSGAVRVCHWLATYSIDPFFWTLILWLVVRWTRQYRAGTANNWLLFLAGVVTAFSLQTKFLVPALWVALVIAALVFGPRRLPLVRPLWLGGAFAVVTAVPTLLWQAHNGWPYIHMAQVVAAEYPGLGDYLWDGLGGAGLVIGLPLLVLGLAWLLFARELAPYRFVAVATIMLTAAFALSSGRSYYLFGLYAVPLAAAAVALQRVRWAVGRRGGGRRVGGGHRDRPADLSAVGGDQAAEYPARGDRQRLRPGRHRTPAAGAGDRPDLRRVAGRRPKPHGHRDRLVRFRGRSGPVRPGTRNSACLQRTSRLLLFRAAGRHL